MFKEVYSDLWLHQKDVNIDLRSTNNVVNPIAAVKILNAVKKIVNIVHGNNKYEVIFNGQEETAYINYKKKAIVITSQLLKNPDSKYSLYDIIDIETGLALHESGHAEYTPNPMDKKNEEAYNTIRSNIKANIHNIIEDCIMEKIVAKDFPGYEAYFIKLRNHYFKNDHIQVSGNDNADRINEFLIGLRYTGKAKLYDPLAIKAVELINSVIDLPVEELKKVDRIELTHKVYDLIILPETNNFGKSNFPQVRVVSIGSGDEDDDGEYGDYDENSPTIIIFDEDNVDDSDENENEEDDENININEENNSESENQENEEKQKSNESDSNGGSGSNTNQEVEEDYDLSNQEIGGDLEDYLKQIQRENESKLDDNENTLINNIIEEDFSENEMVDFGRKFTVTTCKPKIIPTDVDVYKRSLKRVNKLIMKFRNKFSDANTVYRQNAYGLSRGNLDEDSLYSAKYNRNIFMNNVVTTMSRTKNIDIAFTIDCSGSMWEELDNKNRIKRYEAARDLAILFTEALAPINSINTWVFGFQESTDYLCHQLRRSDSKVSIYDLPEEEREKLYYGTQLITLYSPNMKTKHAIGSLRCDGYTPEYEGLSETINVLNKQGRRDSKKVVVMLTDGGPYSNVFGTYDQCSLIKDKLKECKKKNITVIHLALTHEAESTPYENKVKWKAKEGYEGLVDGFIKTLQKQIS